MNEDVEDEWQRSLDPKPLLNMLMTSVFLRTMLTPEEEDETSYQKFADCHGKLPQGNHKQQVNYDAKRSKKEYGEGNTVVV